MAEIFNLVEKSQQLLEDNKKDWTNKWNEYADKITANIKYIQKCRKTFQKWHPLKIYLNVSESKKGNPEFSIRFKGQGIANLVLDKKHKPLLKITKGHSTANKKYFNFDSPDGKFPWNGSQAKEFRKVFNNCKERKGKSEEHMLESLILDEMECKSSEKFKGTFLNVQPVGLAETDLRFQMPVPLSGNTGQPKYTRGNIDIFARVGRGAATKLAIMELKRNERKSYKHAVAQSIIYTLCIQNILRNKTIGEKWWKIFGFKRSLPNKTTLHATAFLPQNLKDLYDKEIINLGLNKQDNHIQLGNDSIISDYVFFNMENERILVTKQSLFNY